MTNLAEHLGASKYAGRYAAQVTFSLFVDTVRHDSATPYLVSILTPLPVLSLVWANQQYFLTIGSGHPLNPAGANNRIDILPGPLLRAGADPAPNPITFQMALTGQPLTNKDGGLYIAAISGAGPAITLNNGDPDAIPPLPPSNWWQTQGARDDLHFGDEADADPMFDYPAGDRWLRNQVESMDVILVRRPVLVVGSTAKRAHFQ